MLKLLLIVGFRGVVALLLRGVRALDRRPRLENDLRPVWGLALAWRAAALRLRLRPVEDGVPSTGWLSPHGLEVRLELENGISQQSTAILIRDPEAGSGPLTVEPQESMRGLAGNLVRRDHEVGDPAFDREFIIHGRPVIAQALLDQTTRHELAELLSGRAKTETGETLPVVASYRDGVLRVRAEHPAGASVGELVRQVFEVLAASLRVAGRLARPKDPVARLAAQLGAKDRPADTEAGVRRAALRMLLRDYREHRETARVLARVRHDPDPLVRLVGALARGGVDEESLLREAAHPDAEVAKVAAEALGRLGTAAAVPALRALEERGSLDLTRAARQAIAEIQSRLTGAEQGQLSLVGGAAGALTLASEDEPGRLSLVREARDDQQDEAPSEAAVDRPVEREGAWNP